MTNGAFTNVLMLPPQDDSAATAAVLLLHGLGANGEDLLGLAPYWAPKLPHVCFIAPDAPFACDMAPYGFQWFSLRDRLESRIRAEVNEAAILLNGLIDQILDRMTLKPERLALVGFSQGCMMSLHVSLRRPAPLAGVIGYSGRLIDAPALPAEITARPPVLLVHGDADPVVPYDSLALAEAALQANDVPVETLTCRGMGHSIDQTGLDAGAALLQKILPR